MKLFIKKAKFETNDSARGKLKLYKRERTGFGRAIMNLNNYTGTIFYHSVVVSSYSATCLPVWYGQSDQEATDAFMQMQYKCLYLYQTAWLQCYS